MADKPYISPTAQQELKDAATYLRQGLVADAPHIMADLKDLRNDLEGPKPLRALATIGGLFMAVVSGIPLMDVTSALIHPCYYAMHVYLCLFGICVLIIESKSAIGNEKSQLKQAVYRWAPFTAIVGGKGFAYLVFGSLGLSLGYHERLQFIAGAYMAAVGVVYLLIHFTKAESLRDKYDQSLYCAYKDQGPHGRPYRHTLP